MDFCNCGICGKIGPTFHFILSHRDLLRFFPSHLIAFFNHTEWIYYLFRTINGNWTIENNLQTFHIKKKIILKQRKKTRKPQRCSLQYNQIVTIRFVHTNSKYQIKIYSFIHELVKNQCAKVIWISCSFWDTCTIKKGLKLKNISNSRETERRNS